MIHIAEERKRDADLLGECGVGGGTVYADAEDYGVASFELGHISLIGLQFLGSTARECQNVKGQDDGFLAAKITELHRFPIIREQGEIRRDVSHLQVRFGDGVFLSRGGKLARHQEQEKKRSKSRDDSLHRSSPRGIYRVAEAIVDVFPFVPTFRRGGRGFSCSSVALSL
jgi:hypothetical protein